MQYSSQLNVVEAHLFMSMYSDEVFNNRPSDNPTVHELVEYMLQSELLGMSKLGSYSGKMMSLHNYLMILVHDWPCVTWGLCGWPHQDI